MTKSIDEYLAKAADVAEKKISDLLIEDVAFRKTVASSLAKALTDANYLSLTHKDKKDEEFVQQIMFLICQGAVHKMSTHLHAILNGGQENATGH